MKPPDQQFDVYAAPVATSNRPPRPTWTAWGVMKQAVRSYRARPVNAIVMLGLFPLLVTHPIEFWRPTNPALAATQYLLSTAIAALIWPGQTSAALSLSRSQSPHPRVYLSELRHVPALLLVSLPALLIVPSFLFPMDPDAEVLGWAVGLGLLLFVPSVFLWFRLMFVPFVLVDQSASLKEAVADSFRQTGAHWWRLLKLWALPLLMLIIYLSINPDMPTLAGIVLLLFASPFMELVFAHAYSALAAPQRNQQ